MILQTEICLLGFTQLKPFAKIPSFNINIGPASTYVNDTTTCTANFAGGNTTDIMFALGYGDASNASFGFSSDNDRIAYDVIATGTAIRITMKHRICKKLLLHRYRLIKSKTTRTLYSKHFTVVKGSGLNGIFYNKTILTP